MFTRSCLPIVCLMEKTEEAWSNSNNSNDSEMSISIGRIILTFYWKKNQACKVQHCMHIADKQRRKPFQHRPECFGSLPQCVPLLTMNNEIWLFPTPPEDQAKVPVYIVFKTKQHLYLLLFLNQNNNTRKDKGKGIRKYLPKAEKDNPFYAQELGKRLMWFQFFSKHMVENNQRIKC